MKSLVLALCILTVSGCASSPKLNTRSQVHMGTVVSIALPQEHTHLGNEAFAQMADVDRRLSTYNPKSEISRLNKKKNLKLSPATLRNLEEALDVSRETNGAFDPTVGSYTKGLYKFGTDQEQEPSDQQLDTTSKKVNYKNIQLNGHIARLSAGTEVDLGGIGKGMAVDQAARFLQRRGVRQAVIAAGGDIRCLHKCKMAIRDPQGGPDQWFIEFKAQKPNLSLSTSGVYERKVKGKGSHHLLNPQSGRPVNSFTSVSVLIEGNSTRADGLATALMVMGEEQVNAWSKKNSDVGVLILRDQKVIHLNQRFRDLAGNNAVRIK